MPVFIGKLPRYPLDVSPQPESGAQGLRVADARGQFLLTQAGELFLEYARSLPFSLEYQGFSGEVASLPGKYAPPSGAILLAMEGGRPVGCIALRPHVGDECEIKRFFVKPAARGRGIGHRLLAAAVERAKLLGYRSICLDSSADMLAARRTYEAAGFKPCERYNDDPDPTTVYFRLRLDAP